VKSRVWLLVSFKPCLFVSRRKTGLSKFLGCTGDILGWLFWKFKSKLDAFPRLLACIQSSASCARGTHACLGPPLFGVCRSSSTRPVPHCSGVGRSVTPRFLVLAPAQGKAVPTTLGQWLMPACGASAIGAFPPAQWSVLSTFSVSGKAAGDGAEDEQAVRGGYLIPSGENDVVTVPLMCSGGCLVQSQSALSAWCWAEQFVEAFAVSMCWSWLVPGAVYLY